MSLLKDDSQDQRSFRLELSTLVVRRCFATPDKQDAEALVVSCQTRSDRPLAHVSSSTFLGHHRLIEPPGLAVAFSAFGE